MQNTSDMPPDDVGERRRFVRVQDAVGLDVQRLADSSAAVDSRATQRAGAVRKRDKYSIEGYAEVRRDFPAVAQYIGDLEERIRELRLDGDAGDAPAKPDHKVSLSAGGVYFSSKTQFTPGETVGLTLTLFPSGRRIVTDAVIIDALATDRLFAKDLPTYRSEFIRISDNDRRHIQAHVDGLLNKRASLED